MPATAACLLSEALPHCTATFYPKDGHLSTLVNHIAEIWRAMRALNARAVETGTLLT